MAVNAWRERGDDCMALTEPEWVDVMNYQGREMRLNFKAEVII
nr:hypothetical protein [Methanophagales archaeon]